jgi:catechol 2,3-dioxygenase-like lactoylglutathione lyase family enzyme
MSDSAPVQPHAVGGVHEICFGVPDLDAAAAYWQAFGFRPDARGTLAAAEAEQLYGVNSALESLRLAHQQSDHGLVRLIRWQHPLGSGIGVAPLRAHGGRWVGQFTRNMLDVSNHARVALKQGAPLVEIAPSFIDLSAYNPALFGGESPRPFVDPVIAVREYTLLQPLWRQAFLQRFNYDSALLGSIDDSAPLPASQIVNACFMITSDDAGVFDFYRDVLGLKAVSVQAVPYEQAMASRAVFDLREGECHWCHTYEEPRSGSSNDTRRSGRLYLFRFPASSALPDRQAQSQPGHLGCTLFTWRVRDAVLMREACLQAGTPVGSITRDEFGVEAFACVTPDGMSWSFQQASQDELARMGTDNRSTA